MVIKKCSREVLSVLKGSFVLSKLQTGYLYHITLIMLIGSTILIGIRQFWLLLGDFVDFRLIVIVFVICFFLIFNNTNNLKNK